MLLCAGFDTGKLMRLSFLAASMGIEMKEVKKDQQGMTLGALCGLEPQANGRAPGGISREMLVMAFFPDGLMDRFLKALRDTGDAVALKAVLTPHNRAWTLEKLYREIQMEHMVAQGGKKK